jgi:hypothetical protein
MQFLLTQTLTFARLKAYRVLITPVMTGSLAARAAEPRQVRKEAALRQNPRVPRITWWSSAL